MLKSPVAPSRTELVAEACRRSLRRFVLEAWPLVEPGTPFVANWHLDVICEHLEAITRGEIRRLILNVPPRHMKPVQVDALVLMGDGTRRRLGDIAVGDSVISHHGRACRVTAVHEQGELEVLRIATSSGRATRAAPDHPFLTPAGWTQAGELVVGDTLATVARPHTSDDRMPYRPAAFALAGYIAGDGNVTAARTSCQANVTCLDREQGAHIVQSVEALGFRANWSGDGKRLNLSGGVRDWLVQVGLAGMTSHTKRVPEFVYRGSPAQIGVFLGAYFSCDGTLNQRGMQRRDLAITFNSVSRDLLSDVQHLLLRVGVRSRLRAHRGAGFMGPDYLSWRLTITSQDDTAKFIARVPVIGAKAARLAAWGIRRSRFEESILPDAVESVEPAGRAECRCLTVAGDHSFTADDLVVRNSLATAVFWPCWEWLSTPETKWLFASYAQSLSTRDSLKCRRLIKTEGLRHAGERDVTTLERIGYRGLLRELYGDEAWDLAEDQDAKQRFENTQKGYRLATSVEGSATGEGGDRIAIDDAHKTNEAESETVRESVWEWYSGTMRTRLNQPKTGTIMVIMQRVHEDDLVGHLLREGGWTHLCLPAEYEPKHPFVWPKDPRTTEGELLWPERIGPAEILELKKMGGYQSAGQLQQRPAPAEGLLFKRQHFRTWRRAESMVGALTVHTYLLQGDDGTVEHVDAGLCRVFQTVDVAASDKQTADWTVVSTWSVTPGHKLLLLEVDRQRFDQLDVAAFLQRKSDEWTRPPMWIETFGAGSGPYKTLRKAGYPVLALQREQGTSLDKIARAWAAVAAYEAHEVFHPEQAGWLGDFEYELLSFPNARNDDQVDTVSYAARLAGLVGLQPSARAQSNPGPRPQSAGVLAMRF